MQPNKKSFRGTDPKDIAFLEADSNYTILHLKDGQKQMLSYNLGFLEKELSNQIGLVRANRKFSVNLTHVKRSDKHSIWVSNRQISISRRRKEAVNLRIKKYFLKTINLQHSNKNTEII